MKNILAERHDLERRMGAMLEDMRKLLTLQMVVYRELGELLKRENARARKRDKA